MWTLLKCDIGVFSLKKISIRSRYPLKYKLRGLSYEKVAFSVGMSNGSFLLELRRCSLKSSLAAM